MASDRYFLHHDLLLPAVAHNEGSLKYANDFKVQDRDVFAITYPKSDLRGVLEHLSLFLGRDLSEETLDRVANHCCFSNMKTNAMSNYSLVPQETMDSSKSTFLRKGVAGDWKNHFSPEQDFKFTAVLKEEMNGTNLTFLWDNE